MSRFVTVNTWNKDSFGRITWTLKIINVDMVSFIRPSPAPDENGLYIVYINAYGRILLPPEEVQKIFNIIGVAI